MENQAQAINPTSRREPWNKGKLIGQKPPLRPKHVWSIRTRLQMDALVRGRGRSMISTDREWLHRVASRRSSSVIGYGLC